MKDLMKLMEKKKAEGKEMSPLYKDSKMQKLQELKDEMSQMMKGDLSGDGMQKVQVASDNPEGLKAGLDKAKDLIDTKDGMSDSEEPKEDEEGAEPASDLIEDQIKHEASEGQLSDEEIDQLQALLQKLKQSKSM